MSSFRVIAWLRTALRTVMMLLSVTLLKYRAPQVPQGLAGDDLWQV
jgi:hypothetical protein